MKLSTPPKREEMWHPKPRIQNLDMATDIPLRSDDIIHACIKRLLVQKLSPQTNTDPSMSSLTCIQENFPSGYPTKNCSKLSMLNFRVPMIEPTKKKVHPIQLSLVNTHKHSDPSFFFTNKISTPHRNSLE